MSKKVHTLKCLPSYFQAIWDGRKTFEVRRDDRGFEAGHTLCLREYMPYMDNGGVSRLPTYTGRVIMVKVTYVLWHDDHQGIGMGHCVMALDMANRKRSKEKKK